MNAVRSSLAVGLVLSLALAGCASGAAPSATPSSQPTQPPPTAVPNASDLPASVDPGVIGGGGAGPGPGQPKLVQPKPGTTVNTHPVSIETLEAQIDGRRVVILATWTSGVEPCYVLDTVTVDQAGNEFTISMTEGSAEADVMCIEIAEQHATGVDLGELEPGDYRVVAKDGTAEPIEFTIS